jgi:hypothetical protein
MTAQQERVARRKANKSLAELPTYHDSIPLVAIDRCLVDAGFKETEGAIYCGRDGNSTEKVGERTWLSLTWHKMDNSGRYEIVCYVS